MIERGGGTRFTSESFEGLRVTRHIVWHKFQRHEAVQAGVLGLLHHARATEFLDDAIQAVPHLTDHLKGKWDEFDLYILRRGKVKYLKELETLLIRVASNPPGLLDM